MDAMEPQYKEAHRKFRDAVRLYTGRVPGGVDEEGQALAVTHMTVQLAKLPNRRTEALLRSVVSGLVINLLDRDDECWEKHNKIMAILHGIES